jgi:hypothetical protein
MKAEDGVQSRYHDTTGEYTAGQEDFVRAVLNCRACELLTAL